MAKKITRTVTSYQTKKDGVVRNNLSMVEAMEEIKNGADYLGEKEMTQYMDIATWNANCEMVEKEVK